MTRPLSLLVIWTVAAALLWWPRMPGRWRQALAIFSSVAGLLFLIVAVNTEGLRESPTTAVFLMGAPYVTEEASASASLPYYVLTGVCLLLGTIGLAAGDELAPMLSRRWMATAIGLSLAVTALRFVLEKMAAPAPVSRAVGITWLAPVVGAYFALNLKAEGKRLRSLLGALALYAFAVRGAVASLMVVASLLHLGSHYDVSTLVRVRNPLTGQIYHFASGSFAQVLNLGVIPQLVFWPLYTVLAGLLGAGVVMLIAWRSSRLPRERAHVGMAAAGEDR